MVPASRWTGWSAATSASARPRSRCAPPSPRSPAASRSRCSCPTTLLAEQHFQTFSDRFAEWPVKIAELSRFRSPKEVDGSGRRASHAGSVDIVIGTHKLLSSDVKIRAPRPGHHRRGAPLRRAAEGALKALRAEVDVLTLTATPIPRTLAMTLEGIRDFSVIATAPQRRLAIKTFVRKEIGEPDPRGAAARAEARRPGLLPAQRGRDDREPARAARGAGARGAHRHRARPDAGARARARDARLPPAALQRAAVHDDHRDRHRRARPPTPSSSTAPTSSASRSCTSCAAASAARTTRPTPT